MNSLIETLNSWGGNFLSFAWPMLWQSSLLILVMLTFDFAVRRRLRASIRYALWLVVLMKLCLPPTLALPTSPAWWLHATPPPIAAKAAPHYTVTYDNGPMPEIPQAPLPVFVPPRPAMYFAAWLLVFSAAVSSALLAWLLARWWQITRHVRRAKTSDRLAALAGGAQEIVGIKFNVPVKLTQNSMSPAVCGLFRPAILIPQALAENFSDEQLRAVLLHELIHLRRRDVWVNFSQALLQIFYWWHPLVWLANTRIRRVREEAVDDAVMLALRDKAESYASTLLEVAKLALNRPLASLGLVGILESRHALRQRIERLVDFRAPRQAGLTLVSLLEILAFTAVAVPMGGAPSPAEKQMSPLTAVATPPHAVQKTNLPAILITACIYQMGDSEFETIVAGLKLNRADPSGDPWWSASPEKFLQLGEKLELSELHPITRPRIQTSSGVPAMMYVGDGTNGIEFDCTPFIVGARVDLTILGKVVESKAIEAITNQFSAKTTVENNGGFVIRTKNTGGSSESNVVVVGGIQFVTNEPSAHPAGRAGKLVQDAKVNYEMGKLDEAEKLLKSALAMEPENATAKYYLGLVQTARQPAGIIQTSPGRQKIVEKLDRIRLPLVSFERLSLAEALRQLSGAVKQNDPEKTGVNFLISTKSDSNQSAQINSVVINIPALSEVRFADVLDAIVLVADQPIKYSIEDYGIVFSAKSPADDAPLFMRTFRVDPKTFNRGLENISTQSLRFAQTNGSGGSIDIGDGGQDNSSYVFKESSASSTSARAKMFFTTLGINLLQPPGKSVFFNDRLGYLFVKATESDLDTIERAIQVLIQVPPQIHIKARFYEVPKGTLLGFQKFGGSSNSAAQFTGILNATNAKAIMQALQTQSGIEVLGEPEVTTTSGRQTQMRATDVVTMVTNTVFHDAFTNQNGTLVTNAIIPQTRTVETGPVLDVVPYVLSDGYTINLALIPSVTEFLGYDKSTNTRAAYNRAGEKIDLPEILPRFSVRRVTTTLNLWDGQTALLGGLPETTYVNGSVVTGNSKASDKELLVFITATIVDPAGNRIHSDDEMPSAQTGIPPQPAQPK
jgi:beta-lactamase regulating signal transducer with metallopeptidase domain/tetratricopeptide (TPR) repeat protein